ncbi:MAG: FKBP-type peptidyl-prolyl cis-trans isomerase [Cognaticolwellia sp.]|jgi:FKBP-type peptidyl-prolyl cis-trans isomerase
MRISLLSVLCVILLPSCFILDDSPKFQVAETGLHYCMHEERGDVKPQVGDEIYYSMTVRRGNEALDSKHKKELMPLSPKKNPVLQAFKIMGLGDSMTIALFVDSLPKRMTNKFESGDTMFVDLKILDIRQKKDIDNELVNMRDKADRVRSHVRDHISEFIDGNLSYTETESGLRYIIEKIGNGKSAKNVKRVSLHYAGFLTNGKEFESTFRRGKAKAFYFDKRTQAVPGFTEGLKLLTAGSKATLIIPHNLAYGKNGRGPIPPESDIVIYVELLEVY